MRRPRRTSPCATTISSFTLRSPRHRSRRMVVRQRRRVVVGAVGGAALLALWGPVQAQQPLSELFRKVSPSVVLVRTLERSVTADPQAGLTTIPGLGSGVLISADGKVMTAANGVPSEILQTDASIIMGNSGGPMFNMDGEVVGIVSRILTQSGGFEGVGFAVSAKVAQRVLLTAKAFWTGVDGVLLQDTLAQIFNLPQPAGFLVQQVATGSPAALLGIRAGTWPAKIGTEQLLLGGDIVLAVGGIAITPNGASLDQIQSHLSQLRPGDSITVNALRGGKVVRLSIAKPR